MNFEIGLNIVEFLIPPVCSGVLMAGFILFLYMTIQYRSRLYLSMAMLGFFGFVFVSSETLLLAFGSWLHNMKIGIQFNRIEQIMVTFFIFGIPFALGNLVEIKPGWKKFNNILAYAGLAIAVFISICAFIQPDLFISFTKHKYGWLKFEDEYSRGSEGILYLFRDVCLFLLVTYSVICIIADIILNKIIDIHIFLLIGIFLAIYSGIVDMLQIYIHIPIDPLSGVRFSRFCVGITLLIIFSMAGLARRFIDSAKEVERINKEIIVSEEKYRMLVEGTTDYIFSLDSNFRFITANNSMLKQIKTSPEDINSLSFYDLIYSSPEDKNLTIQIIHEKLDRFLLEKTPIEFKVTFKSHIETEPKDLKVRFEYITDGDKVEILGKATNVVEDFLLKYFHSEDQKFVIGNYLIVADELSLRIVRNLQKYMDQQEVLYLRTGLREILINAIEHGNLDIDFEEKTRATSKGNYLEFISKRQQNPEYANRTITIEYSLHPDKVVYQITDQGKGFNYKEVIEKINNEVNKDMLLHGRGISIACKIFDKILFNESGNSVKLIKYLGPNPNIPG